MMIVFFRHGPAGSADPKRWPDDGMRPLTERGRVRTLMAAHGLRRLLGDPDLIVTSPLKRAAETADILSKVGKNGSVQTLDALSPGGSDRKILDFLRRHRGEGTLIMVGHEPDLGRIAGMLSGTCVVPLKKAGVCAVEWDGAVGPGEGRLRWLLPPAILRRLGRKKVRA